MKLSLGLVASSLALSGVVHAQQLIGVSGFGDVYRVDAVTGNFELLLSNAVQANAMARRSDGTILIGGGTFAAATAIYAVDPATGAVTPMAEIPLASLRGLAYGPYDVLYAINDSSGSGIGLDDLYTIDLEAGTAVLIGSTGYFGVQGLAYGHGTLYGWEVGSGGGEGLGLITIDPASGAATDVDPAVGGTFNQIQGLAFAPDGTLFGARYELYEVDVATGDLALIGATGGTYDLRGIEYLGLPGVEAFCTSKTSSIGCIPTLEPTSPVASKLGFPPALLSVGPVPGGDDLFGILLYSTQPPALPLDTSFGFLCLGGFARVGGFVASPGGTPGTCSGVYAWDLSAVVAALPEVLPGDELRLQAWYRDPGFQPPGGANLTHGIDGIHVVP
jgi:hypothetical protein